MRVDSSLGGCIIPAPRAQNASAANRLTNSDARSCALPRPRVGPQLDGTPPRLPAQAAGGSVGPDRLILGRKPAVGYFLPKTENLLTSPQLGRCLRSPSTD